MTRLKQITAAIATLCVLSCGGDGGGDPTAPDTTVANVLVNGASTISPGGQSLMTATAVNAAGNALTGLGVTWSSSATSVATIDGTGLVTAMAVGTTTITATISGKPGVRQVNVVSTPVSISPAATVTVSGSTFAPPQVDISAGGSVTWNFDDYVAHTVAFSGSGAPANIPATSSTSVERTFPTAGTFPYNCTIHYGMQGTVVVH